MGRVDPRHSYFVVVAVAMSSMIFATPILAQQQANQDDIVAGRIAGENDAAANVNRMQWFAAGCLFGLLTVAAAYMADPKVPATQLLGKSSEYVIAYTEAYKATAMSAQRSSALKGCTVGCIVNVSLGVITGIVFWIAGL